MFKAGYKPDARSYNVQREDIEHFLKHGETLHGEWWYKGKRIPRKVPAAQIWKVPKQH